jgi:hypothetical protein
MWYSSPWGQVRGAGGVQAIDQYCYQYNQSLQFNIYFLEWMDRYLHMKRNA